MAGLAVVGTAGLRMAANGGDLVRAVREQCGVVVEVISGDDEARLAYRAATADLGSQGSRVGSSQFSFSEGDRVEERFGIEVGAVRFTEQFGLDGVVDDDVLTRAFAAMEQGTRAAGRPSAGPRSPLAGACIVRTVMRMLGQDSVRVSDRGLRYGLLAERFG